MSDTLFKKLREQIDQYSVGFPETDSGIEIEILKKLFTEEEADTYLNLSMQLEMPSSFSERMGRDGEQSADLLENMAKKGLLFRKRKGDNVYYAAVPFVVGFYEFQLKRMDKDFAKMVEDYFNEVYLGKIGDNIPPLRTIPVGKSFNVAHNVASYENAREIIISKEKIAIADCICRTQQKLLEKGCGKPLEVCFLFGSHADYYLENKMARVISQEEALSILDTCEAAGLVNQPANMINPGGMCNCCGDCCGVLRALRNHPNPSEQVTNNYWVHLESDACTGCGLCLDRCQMEAIRVEEEGISVIEQNRCIGCGLCVTTCPENALSMVLKDEDKRQSPHASGLELMSKTAEKRGTSLIPLSMEGKF